MKDGVSGRNEVSQKNSTENALTKSEYKNLRKKTPSNEIRKMVNPDGPKVDPVYGYEVDKFEADHIVSMKETTDMDGFGRLTKEKQIEVLNLKDNFVGLGKSTNASKGAHSWADWKGHSGWYIGPVEDNDTTELYALYAYQLLKIKPEIIQVLALPNDFMVVFEGNEIKAVLNENDVDVLKGSI